MIAWEQFDLQELPLVSGGNTRSGCMFAGGSTICTSLTFQTQFPSLEIHYFRHLTSKGRSHFYTVPWEGIRQIFLIIPTALATFILIGYLTTKCVILTPDGIST